MSQDLGALDYIAIFDTLLAIACHTEIVGYSTDDASDTINLTGRIVGIIDIDIDISHTTLHDLRIETTPIGSDGADDAGSAVEWLGIVFIFRTCGGDDTLGFTVGDGDTSR